MFTDYTIKVIVRGMWQQRKVMVNREYLNVLHSCKSEKKIYKVLIVNSYHVVHFSFTYYEY